MNSGSKAAGSTMLSAGASPTRSAARISTGDAMSKDGEPEHRWYYVERKPYEGIPHQFIKGKHEYFPFPADVCAINPSLHQLNGWAVDE